MRSRAGSARRRDASYVSGVLVALAHVVKQKSAVQHGGFVQLRQQIAVALDGRIARPAQIGQYLQSDQGMLIHRVAMIEVAYDQALDLRHFGKDSAQHASIVHAAQGQRRVRQ